jgi:hypothetical protein
MAELTKESVKSWYEPIKLGESRCSVEEDIIFFLDHCEGMLNSIKNQNYIKTKILEIERAYGSNKNIKKFKIEVKSSLDKNKINIEPKNGYTRKLLKKYSKKIKFRKGDLIL